MRRPLAVLSFVLKVSNIYYLFQSSGQGTPSHSVRLLACVSFSSFCQTQPLYSSSSLLSCIALLALLWHTQLTWHRKPTVNLFCIAPLFSSLSSRVELTCQNRPSIRWKRPHRGSCSHSRLSRSPTDGTSGSCRHRTLHTP